VNRLAVLGTLDVGIVSAKCAYFFLNTKIEFAISGQYKEYVFEIESPESCEINVHIGHGVTIERVIVSHDMSVIRDDFAVIIPMFNTSLYMKRAVESVLIQSVGPSIIYIIDDASTDHSLNDIKQQLSANPRVRILTNKINVGPFLSKNLVIKKIKSQYSYVAFLDSDDFILHDAYKAMFDIFRKEDNCLLVYPHLYRIKGHSMSPFNGAPTRRSFAGCLLNSIVFEKIGLFEPLRYGADGGFFYRCDLFLGSMSVYEIKAPLYRAEIREGSLTRSAAFVDLDDTKENYLSEDRKIYTEIFLKNPKAVVSYTQAHGVCRSMLSVPIQFSIDYTLKSDTSGLIIQDCVFKNTSLSIDVIVDVLISLGKNIYLNEHLQIVDPKELWLCVWI